MVAKFFWVTHLGTSEFLKIFENSKIRCLEGRNPAKIMSDSDSPQIFSISTNFWGFFYTFSSLFYNFSEFSPPPTTSYNRKLSVCATSKTKAEAACASFFKRFSACASYCTRLKRKTYRKTSFFFRFFNFQSLKNRVSQYKSNFPAWLICQNVHALSIGKIKS